MIEFGKTLRAAREAKGLTTGDIAQRTHMMIQTVEGLENEDFSRIVAPIYGRGFVKLYCETVGLEPKPMIDAFMELFNGTKAKESHQETPPPAPPKQTAPAPAPAPAETAPAPEQSLSRYAGNLPSELDRRFRMPMVNWRLMVLGAAALAVLLLIVFAISAIYRATMTAPEEQTETVEEEVVEEPVAVDASETDKAPRKPLPLKPFYIDSDHSTETERK